MQAKAKFDVIMNCNVILLRICILNYALARTPMTTVFVYTGICSYSKNDIK